MVLLRGGAVDGVIEVPVPSMVQSTRSSVSVAYSSEMMRYHNKLRYHNNRLRYHNTLRYHNFLSGLSSRQSG
ncbi:hypothetical protein AURDEDRAFT_178518 [Auricularia subglabra TFB-10046 SS5]|uniref:Uncharacterized protein n=1 Tax=Auricularia subglabra (strain TFB-10046 / SS5) TaxID=717982 RepID=J0WJE4_AURST|nr:hypothetical protein AURDEDRAFT_178518 [Auricularia subglabra TFB-10046 SS5]